MKRIIGLIDMDCFYAQVEQREQPNLWGKPVIVVQHSRAGAQGGILAVSYEARPFGVKRGMSVSEAKSACPHINICNVPIGEYADKADIQKYRDASAEVFSVLNSYDDSIVVEKASVDEAFLDMSEYVDKAMQSDDFRNTYMTHLLDSLPTSHIADGNDMKESNEERISRISSFLDRCSTSKEDDSFLRLAIAARTIEEIRAEIRDKTQFFCSAGIANNKMMAKLVCARHKPRQQTIVPWESVKEILKNTPIGDVRGFGGKMGWKIRERLGISTMGEILTGDTTRLIEEFPEQHEWLRFVAQGYDDEAVRARAESSSIAVSKNFPGRTAISTISELRQWTEGLIRELSKRLMSDQLQHSRTAESLQYALLNDEGRGQKTLKINNYHPDILFEQIWKALKVLNKAETNDGPDAWRPKIYNIYFGATKFVAGIPKQSRAITEWIDAAVNKKAKVLSSKTNTDDDDDDDAVIFIHEEKAIAKPSDVCTVIDLDENEPCDEDMIEVDGKRFTKNAFNNLPPFVKKQYEHRMALEVARKLKSKSTGGNSKRKRAPPENDAKKTNKKSKPLTTFFTKKT